MFKLGVCSPCHYSWLGHLYCTLMQVWLIESFASWASVLLYYMTVAYNPWTRLLRVVALFHTWWQETGYQLAKASEWGLVRFSRSLPFCPLLSLRQKASLSFFLKQILLWTLNCLHENSSMWESGGVARWWRLRPTPVSALTAISSSWETEQEKLWVLSPGNPRGKTRRSSWFLGWPVPDKGEPAEESLSPSGSPSLSLSMCVTLMFKQTNKKYNFKIV